ncbi:MAG: pyridoxamine 5'-phosphate oxidase family protein [Actinobacteria bacterium]|nr:pyridoxamine 5'-phosphate oxidase family protein [Actinomycetota bacterium]
MTSWGDFKALEPQMADLVERLFAIRRHKTLATLRVDGSPRISGIECAFDDGNLHFGSMDSARKSSDIHRDPRIALHSPTVDPVEGDEAAWPGESKIAGIAISAGPIEGPDAPPGERFVVDVTEVVVIHLNEDATKLVVEWWTPDGGRQIAERT